MRALLLCSVLLVLSTGAALASPGADELALTRQSLLSAIAAGPKNCKAFCEGSPVDDRNSECWGLFKVWCGPPPSEAGAEPTHQLTGLVCQGHWKSLTTSVPAGPSGASVPAIINKCEGGHKWFSSRTSTCPHSGHTHKKMMGLLSAGEIINVMTVTGPQAALLQAQAQQQQQDAEGQRWYQEVVEELQRLNVPRSAAAAAGGAEDEVFSLESKNHGFKVEARATKRLPPSSSPVEEETFASLADEMEELFGPSWRDWLPGGPPPPPARHGNGTFELLCNGKPAWLHGAVPCWGNFTVAATRSWSPSSSASSADGKKPCTDKKEGHPLRRLLSSPLRLLGTEQRRTRDEVVVRPLVDQTSLKAMERSLPRGTAASAARVGAVVGHSEYMKAECDGLWSGVLGHTCMGVSTSHVEITEEEEEEEEETKVKAKALRDHYVDDDDDDDDEPTMSKWSICSGRQSIRFVHREYTYGMVVACKGSSVLALNITMEGGPDA